MPEDGVKGQGGWGPRPAGAAPRAPSTSALRSVLGESLAAGETDVEAMQAARLLSHHLYSLQWPPEGTSDSGQPDLVPVEVETLSRRTGLSGDRVEAGLQALERHGFLARAHTGGGLQLGLTSALLTPAPVAGRIAWRRVLDCLEGQTVAQLVFLAFVDHLGAPEAGFREIRHDRLARDTHLGSRSVTKGVGQLVEDVRLIDRHERRGTTNRYRLAQSAFGGDATAPSRPSDPPDTRRRPSLTGPGTASSGTGGEGGAPPGASGGRTLEVGSVRIELPGDEVPALRVVPRPESGYWLVIGDPDGGVRIPFEGQPP